MTRIALTVNGAAVVAEVESRLSLADFLRERRRLTGTHLGCEHGVCGACTVELDGEIARSCINLAVACDGAVVRTIEGFDDDPLMDQLRRAFSREHALQCGYCTPGMLIAARDLCRRKPGADEATIRKEMSGNLCRCTGYVGIIRAIKSVIGAPAPTIAPVAPAAAPVAAAPSVPRPAAARARPAAPPVSSTATRQGWTRVEERLEVPFPPDQVWALFQDIRRVAPCMPGAELVDYDGGPSAKGRVTAKFGPIAASFEGEARFAADPGAQSGTIAGTGRDRRSATRAEGEVRYRLTPIDSGKATRVDIVLEFGLAGPLAQFGRSALIKDFVARLTAQFAHNVAAALSGSTAPPARLDAGGMLWAVLRAWLRRLFGRGG
ncbi:MAG: SRPBCC family protein [Alphaproteobacteria bacterium]|nr:SRPBCC family protein [Alphaproteobacteria bacterium]